MRRQTRLKLIAGSVGLVVLLLVLVLTLVVRQRLQARDVARQAMLEAQAAAEAANRPAPVDPFAAQEQTAVRRVMESRTRDGSASIEGRVAARTLETHLDVFAEIGAPRPEWVARRAEGSVYEVVLTYTFHGIVFGPRWFVQLDPEGPQPAGSGGVVATNALAAFLGDPSSLDQLRYYNRSDEVVEALTNHRFDNGTRLGAALLIQFLGRGQTDVDQVIGWTVIPDEIDPDGELVYSAYFQWREGDGFEDAIWRVGFRGGQVSFRARDRRADTIMGAGAVDAGERIDIRPVSMRDVDRPAEAERDPRVRALRHVLTDERIVEAVGALLAYRAREVRLDYVQWFTNYVEDDREWCVVEYRYRENGYDKAVSWRVHTATGERVPTEPSAALAELALRVARPAPAAATP